MGRVPFPVAHLLLVWWAVPSAPTSQLPAQARSKPQALRAETDEEAELRALEESMAFG
jgi:hypothetical protein